MNSTTDYYPVNEDKFGFLVFDKKSIEAFNVQYSSLEKMDVKFIEAFKVLQNMAALPIEKGTANTYANHTNAPGNSDAELAYKVLDAVSTSCEEKYFSPAFLYLFFYQCLPKEFQYKWMQKFLGDFKFNVTFFRLLRNNNEIFDRICCGEGYWDSDISKIFGDWETNEIISENAKDLRTSILQSEVFNDSRLQIDKELFLGFLNNVIEGKWRLFFLDWN